MNKKVIVVYVGDILRCPPALSVIQALANLQYKVIVVTTGTAGLNIDRNIGGLDNVKVELVENEYNSNTSLINKFYRMFNLRKKYWDIINEYYDDETVIWVVSETAVKHLGKELLKKRYILHQLELIEDMYYISGNPILKLDSKQYAGNALAVIEAEYNRAHITKAWWQLEKLPYVLPNKPYNILSIEKNAAITSSIKNQNIIEKLKDKRIILYQGNYSKERPLDAFIDAVKLLGDPYVFVLMTSSDNPYPELDGQEYYQYISFVEPPYHLEITSHAYIGVLSYTPIKNSYSILNTLYCAPNKIWEYTKFGVPMISNDLPALKYSFEINKMGKCVKKVNPQDIVSAICEISENYISYSSNASKFYDSFDFEKEIRTIMNGLEE